MALGGSKLKLNFSKEALGGSPRFPQSGMGRFNFSSDFWAPPKKAHKKLAIIKKIYNVRLFAFKFYHTTGKVHNFTGNKKWLKSVNIYLPKLRSKVSHNSTGQAVVGACTLKNQLCARSCFYFCIWLSIFPNHGIIDEIH